MKNTKLIITGAVCTAIGISAGMGAMYGLQKKNIDFAKRNSLLMEVQSILDEKGKKLPDGADPEKAAAKGYLTQFLEKFTLYIDMQESADNKEVIDDLEAGFKNGNILYVDINGFITGTQISFAREVDPLIPKASGIIIDLRNNGGGVTQVSTGICNRFLSKGEVHFVYDNGGDEYIRMNVSRKTIDLPVVILVNGNTASAAEIMTALFMQNYENVTVVGTQTYGKGVFQGVEELSNGDEIRFVNGYYTVGDWDCYNEIGITPDIVLEMDESLIGTFSDTQLKKALELLG